MSDTHPRRPSEAAEPGETKSGSPLDSTAIGPGPEDAIDLEADPEVETTED